MWLFYTGCGSHGSVHSKGDVGKGGMVCRLHKCSQSSQCPTVVNYDSDSTIAYDLEEVMNMGYESSSNHSDNIPSNIDEVIRAITPVAWLDNPLPRPQHVVTDNYSPASPVYSPDHSPIQIDSDEEGVESRASMAPAPT